ncbi:MAG TPA: hypothetical protein VHX87_08340 [Galbitalea sp.]|nr:hypothetical protein [Galbitalea sp.]
MSVTVPKILPAEAPTVRGAFRERSISIRSMDLPQRIALAATLAGLLGAAILIGLRGVSVTRVPLGVVDGEQVVLALPLFVATLLLLSVGVGLLIAGSLFAHPAIAAVAAVALTVFVGWATGLLGIGGFVTVLPDWAAWAARGVLVAVWLVALATVLLRRGRFGEDTTEPRLRLAVMIALPALFVGYFVILSAASPVVNGLDLFPQTIHLLTEGFAIIATPMVMIAAVDFGEWGDFAADRLARIRTLTEAPNASKGRRYLVPVALAIIAVAYGVSSQSGSPGDRIWQTTQAVLLVAAVLGILASVGRALRLSGSPWPRTLGFAGLVCVCAVIALVGPSAVAALSGAFATPPPPAVSAQGDYTPSASVRSVTGVTGSTVLVPTGWDAQPDKSGTLDSITNLFPDGLRVDLIGLPVDPGTPMSQIVQGISTTAIGAAIPDGVWQKQRVSPAGGGTGVVWLYEHGSTDYAYYGLAVGKSASSGLTQLEAIVRTYRPAGEAPATLASILKANGNAARVGLAAERQDDIIQALGAGFAAVTAALAIVALAMFGRVWSTTWRLAVLFYGAAATVTVVTASASIARVVFGPDIAWPILTVGGAVAAAGLIGLVALAVTWRSHAGWAERLPATVPGILGAVIVLGIIHQLYGIALDAAVVPQWAAILILVAVGWEIVMSGESMTNQSSRRLPRSTRLMVFFGYILVLAAALVFYSGQYSTATGRVVSESFFEPESITQSALFRIAFPLLLVVFLLRLTSHTDEVASPDPSPQGRNSVRRTAR